MIENIQKILFIGLKEKREEFTEKLQELGVFQIEEYTGTELETNDKEIDSSHADNILATYKNLKKYHDEALEYVAENNTKLGHSESLLEIVDSFPHLEKELNNLKEIHNLMKVKKDSILPWGHFDLSEIKNMAERSKLHIQFWEISVKHLPDLEIPEDVTFIDINHDNQRKYFLTFAKEKVHLETCLEIEYDEDIATLEKEIGHNLNRQEEIRKKIYSFTYDKKAIFEMYIDEINKINYEKALASSVNTAEGMIFAIHGWIPSKARKKIEKVCKELIVKTIDLQPEKDEKIPTYIENKNLKRMGQDLVEFYDTPSYMDWDPSAWLFMSFVLFFSMILADGGYGLMIFLFLFYIRFKNRKSLKDDIKRVLSMGMVLSFATAIYGIAGGSFFGVSQSNPIFGELVKMQLFNGSCTNPDGSISQTALNNMMKVSLAIGAAHISFSLLLNGIRYIFAFKKISKLILNLTWITLIWSFFIYRSGIEFLGIPSDLPILFNTILGCLGGIFVISAAISGTLNPIKMIMGGLGGVYDAIQFFSDVMSYIRIFALGLSGSLIAQTFNSMAWSVWEQGGFFMLLAVLVFVAGHALNLGLCIMSGAIHGLRLNYLEFYRWSFDGGGRPFKPLKKLSVE